MFCITCKVYKTSKCISLEDLFFPLDILDTPLRVWLPGHHHCLADCWSSSCDPGSERFTKNEDKSGNRAKSIQVDGWGKTSLYEGFTVAVWGVEHSGGLQGRPSSSDMVPASSVFFTHIKDGGEPSLMACFSWSCRERRIKFALQVLWLMEKTFWGAWHHCPVSTNL